MHKRVVLLGGGGHASDILAAYEAISRQTGEPHPVIGFLDDGEVDQRRFANRGVAQIGSIDDIGRVDASHYVLALGWPEPRAALFNRVSECGLAADTVVHPLAFVSPGVSIGEGTVILALASITEVVTIGRHVYLSHGTLLGHDCVIEDFVSIMPGASISGDTILGKGCMIGANAAVIQGKSVGAWASVCACSAVTKSVPAKALAFGIPARWREPKLHVAA